MDFSYLGTKKHVETSWYAFKSVFKFLEKRLKERLKNETKEAANEVDATSHPTIETEKVESVGMQSLDGSIHDKVLRGMDISFGMMSLVALSVAVVVMFFFE